MTVIIHNRYSIYIAAINITECFYTIFILYLIYDVYLQVMVSFKIDKQLQTISNYFLFSLAVADLIIGAFSVPLFTVNFIMRKWPFSPHLCDTFLAIDYLASNASVWNLMVISIDRYFSVTRPLSYRATRTTMKVNLMESSFNPLYFFLIVFNQFSPPSST